MHYWLHAGQPGHQRDHLGRVQRAEPGQGDGRAHDSGGCRCPCISASATATTARSLSAISPISYRTVPRRTVYVCQTMAHRCPTPGRNEAVRAASTEPAPPARRSAGGGGAARAALPAPRPDAERIAPMDEIVMQGAHRLGGVIESHPGRARRILHGDRRLPMSGKPPWRALRRAAGDEPRRPGRAPRSGLRPAKCLRRGRQRGRLDPRPHDRGRTRGRGRREDPSDRGP